MHNDDTAQAFLSLSIHLTGFERSELLGTGMLAAYCSRVVDAVDAASLQALWSVGAELERIAAGVDAAAAVTAAIEAHVMGDPRLAAVARSIIKLWYSGSWPVPEARFGAEFVSAAAYQQGLIWTAMGTHPPGARQPGFGSWSTVPVLRRQRLRSNTGEAS